MPNENNSDATKSVSLPVPGDLMDRIRLLQPTVGKLLKFRTKATQYHVVDFAISLLEKRVGK